jgi:hypothetical protein
MANARIPMVGGPSVRSTGVFWHVSTRIEIPRASRVVRYRDGTLDNTILSIVEACAVKLRSSQQSPGVASPVQMPRHSIRPYRT